MESIRYKSLGRDLYADIGNCDCPAFPDTPVLANVKKTMKLSGYADDNFFDNVNREPKRVECHVCKKAWNVQWRRDGVLVETA